MRNIILSSIAILFATLAHAGGTITVKDGWVRAPAPGAQITAAYMTLEVKEAVILASASSPAAGAVEVHSMSMKNGVMEMRQLKNLELKPGQPVKLEPGGLHLMLIDLKKPIKVGDTVNIMLNMTDGKRVTGATGINLPVKSAP